MKTSQFTPSPKDLGSRKLASVREDVQAFINWAAERDRELRDYSLLLVFRGSSVTLQDTATPTPTSIARVQLRKGYWHLQWADRSDRWHDYDSKSYLTLAIPILLIDEDRDGVFWR